MFDLLFGFGIELGVGVQFVNVVFGFWVVVVQVVFVGGDQYVLDFGVDGEGCVVDEVGVIGVVVQVVGEVYLVIDLFVWFDQVVGFQGVEVGDFVDYFGVVYG